MKKLIVSGAILAFVMALTLTATAATKKATLINEFGDKVVVVSGSQEAKLYFSWGYVLMGQSFGANPGSEFSTSYLTVNGVKNLFIGQTMKTATTTLCAFKNPAGNATSTLLNIGFDIATGTSTASTIVIATSTTAHATSSVPFTGQRAVASGAKATAEWTPAVGWDGNGAIIGPNEWILVKTESPGLSGYTYKGTCKARFMGYQ